MSGLSPDGIFEIISFLENNLRHLLVAFFFGKLTEILLGKDEKGRRRHYVAAAYYITMTVLELMPVTYDSFAAYLIGILAVFLVLALESREDMLLKAFFCITLFSIRFHTMSAIGQIHISLFDLESSLFHRATGYRYVTVWQLAMAHIAVYSAVDLLCIYAAFSILTSLIVKNLPFQKQKPSAKEVLFLLMPGILGSLCYFMIHWIVMEVGSEGESAWFNPREYFSIWLAILMINVMSLASMIVVWKLFQELGQKQEEEKRQELLQNQVREMQSHIREIEQLYAGIRGMKHDVRNHIAVMEGLMEQKNYEEARNFLSSMEQAMDCLEYVHRTGNPVTDVIINEKYSRAKEENIQFETEFSFPGHTGLDVFDVSIILNNALENALEAAKLEPEGNRSVTVRSRLQKQVVLIEVKNTFTGTLEWEGESGLPASAKEDRLHHGLGLKNIRRVAEKYYGDLDIEIRGGTFLLTVMLNVNNL